MSRKLSFFLVVVLVASLLLPAAVSAENVVTDGPKSTEARYSHRLIVELSSPPLVQFSGITEMLGSGGKLDVNSPAAQAYVQKLKAEQAQFVASMQSAIPNAKVATYTNENGRVVPATYQILLNAVSVDAGRNANVNSLAKKLLQLPNVKRVSKDYAHDPDLYASLPLINAEAAWNNVAVGGKSNAGAGIKFATMDGGAHKDAAMFDGTGYTYPPGFPKGDTRGTNGKIIVARSYFRTWDPPSAGDENPWPGLRGTEHGNHTASTAAGNEVEVSYLGADPVTISGVAPAAYVMSYRVFYNSITNDGSFYNTEGIKALEDIVADGADVLNNSWGGGPGSIGGEFDALDQALRNAVSAGIFVSMSAGNAGPNTGTGDHPSDDYISVAASTTDGTFASGVLEAVEPAPVPEELKGLSYASAAFGGAIPLGQVLGPYPYASSAVVDPTNAEGCNAFPAGAFAGKAALIVRGTCEFGVKALNAENAGATMFIVYNHATGGDELINMGAGAVGSQVTIPGIFTGNTAGTALLAWNTDNPDTAKLQISTIAFQIGNTPDVIASFSSRGPGVGNVLKPDITAPGVNILAQGYGPGATGEDRHLSFGQASGTSMAAPHVAGAGILLKQIHPDWSPAWIKSALMSTSKYLDIYVDADMTTPAQPLDMGAGRLDLTHAANPGVILDPPSLSFGLVEMGETKSLDVTITSVASATETYAVGTLYTGAGFDALDTVDGMTVSPASITLAPGATAKLTVTWDSAASLNGEGDNQGFVVLDGATYDAHMPAWMRVTYAPDETIGDVLVIDNDGSSSLGLPDYTPFYTSTLESLGLTYSVLDADFDAGVVADFLPEAVELSQYKAIVYHTGDNYYPDGYFTVPTPLTIRDQDRLVEYANQGGTILAFGPDLASVLGATTSSNAHFFYSAILGAEYLQDSINAEEVYTNTAQLMTGLPDTLFTNASFDISGMGDGAANQYYIDEIKMTCNEPDHPAYCAAYVPLLKYSIGGNHVEDGYVALGHRDFPTLERSGVSYLGKSMYFTFGLEGVNDDTGFNTRADLLGSALAWAWDEPQGSITATPGLPGEVTLFTAEVESEFGADGVTYRWDFGDGTPFTEAYTSATAGHTYAEPGIYTVRVQITNELGTTIIVEMAVRIGMKSIYMPLIPTNSNPSGWLDVTILHTNDFHARIDEYDVGGATCSTTANCIGGYARLSTLVNGIRDEVPNVLLVDAGDQFQGTLYYNLFKSEIVAEMMNTLGYEAMTVGNHEFDDGPAELGLLASRADFPIVSTNLNVSAEPELDGSLVPYTIVEKGDHDVAILGVTTTELPDISSPGPNVVVEDPAASVQATVDELVDQGIDKIVVLSHLGYDADKELAAAVSGVDVIVGGHSHTFLYDPETAQTFTPPSLALTPAGAYPTVVESAAAEPVLVVTAFEWGKFLGRLDVSFSPNGTVVGYDGNPIYVSNSVAKDPEIEAMLAPYRTEVNAMMTLKVGEITVDAPISVDGKRICRLGECLMGNLVTDAMLWQVNTVGGGDYQIAVTNGGGLRAALAAGDVTYGGVMTVLPFGNTIATMELTGENLLAALEHSARSYPSENGGFLQVSGMRYTFDPAQPAGSRIVSAEVWNGTAYEALQAATVYKVVTNNFTRNGGDGYTWFRDNAINPYDFGPALHEAVIDYFWAFSPVTPEIEGRINIVTP